MRPTVIPFLRGCILLGLGLVAAIALGSFALTATVLVFSLGFLSWFGGHAIEDFLASKYCWPVIRRATYGAMAFAISWGAINTLIRFFS